MNKKEMIEELGKRGITPPAKANKAELEALLSPSSAPETQDSEELGSEQDTTTPANANESVPETQSSPPPEQSAGSSPSEEETKVLIAAKIQAGLSPSQAAEAVRKQQDFAAR